VPSYVIGPVGGFLRRSTAAGVGITFLLGCVLAAAQDAASPEQPPRVTVPHHVDLSPPASVKPHPLPPSVRFGLDFAGELVPYVLDPVDTAALLAEDAACAEPPLRMGIVRDLGFAVTDGPAVIQPAPGGGSVWSVAFVSPEAKGLRLHFTHVDLPAGAELWLYAPDALEQAEGPYTATGPRRSGEFWSSVVWSEEVRLEYFLPGDTGDPGFFLIEDLAHLYRGLGPAAPTGGGDAREGPCHNDVMCFPDWHPLHNATARITVIIDDGAYGCSATLLNTEAADETPYLLTANHCAPDQAAAESLVVYWFFQTESCDGPPAPHERSDGGDYLVGSTYWQYDQSLLMVNGALPDVGYRPRLAERNGRGLHQPPRRGPQEDHLRLPDHPSLWRPG
jgi:hypothetical protein